jgi:hypothetical protein
MVNVRKARQAEGPDRKQQRNNYLSLKWLVYGHPKEVHGEDDPREGRADSPEDVANYERPELMFAIM